MSRDYLQFGCGTCAPLGWLNFDASPTLRLERLPFARLLYAHRPRQFPSNVRLGDITRGLPVAPCSCQGIYCSHVLEHLSLEDCRKALRHIFACLSPGGAFRLVVPDLERLAKNYLNSSDPMASVRFMESSCLGRKTRETSLTGFLRHRWGHSQHLWMWDERSMREELEVCGFRQVRRARFGDAEDPRFSEVEEADRFDAALAMQGVRASE